MPDYKQTKDEVHINRRGLAGTSTKPGIFLFKSGSIRNSETAVSASVPNIVAITCSSNFNNRLTTLTTLNSYAVITVASGSSKSNKRTNIVLRYVSGSIIADANNPDEILGRRFEEDPLLLYTSSKYDRDKIVNIPIINNDDSYAVAMKTVQAINNESGLFNVICSASLVDDGSGINDLSPSSSVGNMVIGQSFKIRNSASLQNGTEGKFLLHSIQSSSVLLPDFSGTEVEVGTAQVATSFLVGGGSGSQAFSFNVVQSGSGNINQDFYIGDYFTNPSYSLAIEIDPTDKDSTFLTGSGNNKFYFSGSGELGINTDDPLEEIDFRANTFSFQRKAERRGLRINEEGNIESFDKNAETAATGSEFILNFSRGITINEKFVEAVTGINFENDTEAQTFFNNLRNKEKQRLLFRGEREGFINPPQSGDTLGAIRFVAESGSVGTLDKRSTGETAVIKAIVSSVATDGIQADLIFSVADRTGAATQKFLIDAGNEHQVTGSLNINGSVAIEGFLQSQDNPNTKIDFDAGTGDVNIELQPNGNNMMVLSNGGTVTSATGQYGVLINQNHANADFRIDGEDSTSGDFSLFFDASGDGGRGQLYLGGETLADFQGISPAVNAKLHVSGNILADGANGHITASGNISASGTIFAEKIITTQLTSSIVTSSILLTEGSNIFGDNINDGHQFTGSVDISGSLTFTSINGGFF